jgi:hypothetical protein
LPAQAIHRRIIKELNAAGFDELRIPHIAVLQFPGPDGVRPGTLAERAGISKQAMNQLLRSLEGLGYIAITEARGTFLMSLLRADSFGHCRSDLCQVVSGIRTLHTDYGMLWDINESRLFSFTRCLQIGSGS